MMLSRIVLQHLHREAARWTKLPPGWTPASRKKLWESLGGTGEHKITHCMEKMDGKVDSPAPTALR